MAVSRFVGVGVGVYDNGHPRLEHAVPDVEAVATLLEASFDCTVLRNPGEATIKAYLKDLRGSLPGGGGSLVLLWSGHAVRSPVDGLHLLARDSGDYDDDGLGAGSDVAAPCAQSGASQLLLIVDTCFSGDAVTAGELAARIMQRSPPEGEHVWVGVLASCLSEEAARDGLFARRLAGLLEHGPEPGPGTWALLVQRWSPRNQYIRGDDLCDAVLKTWDTSAQTPDFLSHGSAWWMFPNPLYDPGAPERVVEHLLLAARGGAAAGEHSWFTGRAAEVDQVVGWMRSGRPGLHVITGSAGTGKTAVAGRVVSLSNPAERERLLAESRALGHADPGERSVAAHVHARGLTADRAADLIAGQLVRARVLAAQPDRRNAAELVGQLQRAAEEGATPPVIVLDGLDEARGQAFVIAEELLLRLAPYATVIVSTRELRRGETDPSLLDVLTAGTAELDLDGPAAQQRGQVDMQAYIAARLAGVNPAMDPETVADHLAGTTSMTGGSPFLLARLVTDQLRASPVDTSQPGWQDRVSHSIEDALDADLAQVRGSGEAARILLAALTWGFGAGMPEEEWLACANALGGGELGRDDVTWVLDELGRYITQDGEVGVAVYRIAHQTLADHIRPPFAATHQQVFDPQARPVAAALLGRYAALLVNGVPVTGPGYLWRYAWRHAAAAGPAGLELIRGLAVSESQLLPDVAMADQEVSDRLGSWGYRIEAVPPTEEAVQLWRELAGANPAFLPDLATALTNLGACYSEVGRRHDALAPGDEAVQLCRELAAASPAFLPDLATALTNLGACYSEVGRWHDALAPGEEAVQLCRELAAANPAFLPDLATALNNLGNRYSELGRRHDALPPTEEAVQLCRELAAANPAFLPDLAAVLNNLGACYSEVGRRQDALPPTEEAVQLRRELAATNPAFLPDLASALNNLGTCYSEVGRRQDALPPTEEAVQLHCELAATNPAFLPDLASALNNLGMRYSEVGRRQDALPPAEEAVQLRRELAATNPAFLPDLASALNNLGTRYSEIGFPDSGEEAWERVISEAAPQAAAFLLVARAGLAEAGYPAAAAWLVRAFAMDIEDRNLLNAAHNQARRHRGPNPDVFDLSWVRHTSGPLPVWLTVDSALLSSAQAWLATETYTDERDHLAAHPELLEAAADTAIAEALFAVTEHEAQRYITLRQAAQQRGADDAYRPVLLTILAREFADADPDRQRALLADRRDDLLTGTVADALNRLASKEHGQPVAALRATALLTLARTGNVEPVFEALTEPSQFPCLLHTLATGPAADGLDLTAVVAYTAATSIAERAVALFYLAVAMAARGDQEQAGDLVIQARAADPARAPGWINELAEIGQHHPGVLQLIPALTATADQAPPSGPLRADLE